MLENSLAILMVLCALVAATEWAVRRTVVRHFGTALLVIVATALVANLGILPTGSSPEARVPVYEIILSQVAPLSIFWLLLGVELRKVLSAGVPMLVLFTAGAAGTTVGVMIAFSLVDTTVLGDLGPALGGMLAATYIGGSVNFTAVALHYDVVRVGHVYAATAVVDNVLTAAWMIATLAIPRMVAPWWPRAASPARKGGPDLGIEQDTESLHPMDLGLVLALGLGSLWLSDRMSQALAGYGLAVAPILVLTVLALLLAQFPVVARLRGTRVLGMFSIYLFLAVIGAFCDVEALVRSGEVGATLLLLASLTILVHGILTLGIAALLRLDPDAAAIASQANVGGGTSALALARSLGRTDLVLPAILIGALGNGLGTFVGFWIAAVLS